MVNSQVTNKIIEEYRQSSGSGFKEHNIFKRNLNNIHPEMISPEETIDLVANLMKQS
jgi:hypothetical protein